MDRFRAVQAKSLSNQVFEQLVSQIVSGELKPGESLPAERALSDAFGINRHGIREATKRLDQAGLVKVTHGGGTRVLDFRESGGLHLLPVLMQYEARSDSLARIWLSALEMRAVIGSDAARLCAFRGDDRLRAGLIDRVEQMGKIEDRTALYELNQKFWEAVLEGAGNIAYRLAFNSLIRTVESTLEQAIDVVCKELKAAEYHRSIATEIAAGDGERAAAEAHRILSFPVIQLAKASGIPVEGHAAASNLRAIG